MKYVLLALVVCALFTGTLSFAGSGWISMLFGNSPIPAPVLPPSNINPKTGKPDCPSNAATLAATYSNYLRQGNPDEATRKRCEEDLKFLRVCVKIESQEQRKQGCPQDPKKRLEDIENIKKTTKLTPEWLASLDEEVAFINKKCPFDKTAAPTKTTKIAKVPSKTSDTTHEKNPKKLTPAPTVTKVSVLNAQGLDSKVVDLKTHLIKEDDAIIHPIQKTIPANTTAKISTVKPIQTVNPSIKLEEKKEIKQKSGGPNQEVQKISAAKTVETKEKVIPTVTQVKSANAKQKLTSTAQTKKTLQFPSALSKHKKLTTTTASNNSKKSTLAVQTNTHHGKNTTVTITKEVKSDTPNKKTTTVTEKSVHHSNKDGVKKTTTKVKKTIKKVEKSGDKHKVKTTVQKVKKVKKSHVKSEGKNFGKKKIEESAEEKKIRTKIEKLERKVKRSKKSKEEPLLDSNEEADWDKLSSKVLEISSGKDKSLLKKSLAKSEKPDVKAHQKKLKTADDDDDEEELLRKKRQNRKRLSQVKKEKKKHPKRKRKDNEKARLARIKKRKSADMDDDPQKINELKVMALSA